MKKVIQIFLFIAMAAAGLSSAHAACTLNASFGRFNLMADIPQIEPEIDAPDGTVLFSTVLYRNSSSATNLPTQGCSGAVLTLDYAGPHGLYNTMDSGIPGIGVRLTNLSGFDYGSIPTGYLPQSSAPIPNDSYSFNFQNARLTFELVKTGPIPTGTYSLNNELASILAPGMSPSDPGRFPIYIQSSTGAKTPPFTVKMYPTCKVSSSSVQVRLGSVPISRFSGVGSTSPQSELFNIQLACSGGDAALSTNVYTTLTDQTNPANQSDTLSLAAGSTASGVGIQVLSGTTVIKYGPDSQATGNTNQWQAGSTGNGNFNIPLTARYIQTAPQVTAGSANGLMTFTMNYH